MAPKKEKAQKMQLGEFLTDTSLGSWADEMDEVGMPSAPSGRTPYGGGGDRGYGSSGGFGASRFDDRAGPRETLPLPTHPPYTVHLGNLSFDATEGDVHDLFADCAVDSVRIVEDKIDQKPKGFGYVEFKTLDGLKKALTLSGTQFQGRNVRISVAEPQKDRQEQTRDFSDWSRKGPLADAPQQRKVSDRGFGPRPDRSFDNVSEAGSERGGRRGYEPSDGKFRDFGNWERKGPPTPTLGNAAPVRSFERPGSRDGPVLRRNSPAWGEGRSQDSGSRPPRREFVERPPAERALTAAEQDTQWRARMKPDVPTPPAVTPNARSPAQSNREPSAPPSPAAQPAQPATRPKLNLAKRTVTEANTDSAAQPAGESKASPFGAARPIDTATREREVEEKRQIAIREKKEADEKAKEEKRIAEEKAKEEKKLAREAELAAGAAKGEKGEQSPKSPTQTNGDTKPLQRRRTSENKAKAEKPNGVSGSSPAQPQQRFQILQRQTGEEGSIVEQEAEEAEAAVENGLTVGDKETKPQEVVRDPKTDTVTTNGATPAEPTAEALEEEGWSTVSKPQRKGKGASQAARAIAS